MLDINYNRKIVRAAVILTTSYVAGTAIDDCDKYNQLMIFAKYVKGSLTSFQLKVEFSDDGVTYYQQTFESISGGVATCSPGAYSFTSAANQNYVIAIPIKCSKIKISVKGTGTVTSSSLEINAVVGVS